jgi:hypothetical protein
VIDSYSRGFSSTIRAQQQAAHSLAWSDDNFTRVAGLKAPGAVMGAVQGGGQHSVAAQRGWLDDLEFEQAQARVYQALSTSRRLSLQR